MIGVRSAEILNAAVQDFIKTGEPVSSDELYRKYGFRVKPATIRNELSLLDEAGYLVQPHTSAGRVPTDKGYAFYVDSLLSELGNAMGVHLPREVGALREEFAHGEFNDVVAGLAEALQLLSVGFEESGGPIYKSGLEELVGELVAHNELSSMSEMTDIIKDFEAMDERLHDLLNFFPEGDAPRVFIGRSPITRSPHLSVIADSFMVDGERFLLAAVGPKRMDYEGNIIFFNSLKKKMKHETR